MSTDLLPPQNTARRAAKAAPTGAPAHAARAPSTTQATTQLTAQPKQRAATLPPAEPAALALARKPSTRVRAAPSGDDGRARWLLDAMARVLQASQAQHAARALVLHLAGTLGCQRVALGWRMRPGAALQLQALSDVPRLADAPDLAQDLEAAMHEVADTACTLCYPARRRDDARPGLAHVQLGRSLGASAVCSIPLGGRGEVLGALTLQRELGRPFTAGEILQLEEAAAFLSPVLARQFSQPRLTHSTAGQVLPWWRRLQCHWPWAVLALLAGLCAWPVRHDVVASAQVQSLNERQLAAPRDGYITAVHVRPGDSVQAAQALLTLDSEAVQQDLRAAQATLEQAESAFSEALAKHDQGQVVTQLARVDEARARAAQAQADLGRSGVPAPIDGVVVSGDWTRSIGAPVKRGDLLFTVAPDAGLRLNLWVDERDIGDVHVGSAGHVRLASSPGTAWPITVQRLTPVARLHEGRNGFDVEASLTPGTSLATKVGSPPAALRAGLEGVARLDAGRRAWLVSQGLQAGRWLRLQWWTWLG